MSRATLNDLVEDFLRVELCYGEEFSVNNEVGPLYDIDETENLTKKLSELGIKSDSFLTVIDEDEKNPRVNLILSVQESLSGLDDKPIKALDVLASSDGEKPIFEIPRRQKEHANGNDNIDTVPPNGVSINKIGKREAPDSSSTTIANKKRAASEILENGAQPSKRAKPNHSGDATNDDMIIVDDATDGAIVVDD